MASNGPSPHSPSWRLGLPAPQPSRRHHAQSLLGPSFYNPRTHHVLESHPERTAPLSRRDDERCHAIISHSALALRLYLAAYSTSSSCRFWSPPLPLRTQPQLLRWQPGVCALAAPSSGQVQSSFGLIGESPKWWYDFLGTGSPRSAESSTSHNLSKTTIFFFGTKKEGKKRRPEGQTPALLAFESYWTGILTSIPVQLL